PRATPRRGPGSCSRERAAAALVDVRRGRGRSTPDPNTRRHVAHRPEQSRGLGARGRARWTVYLRVLARSPAAARLHPPRARRRGAGEPAPGWRVDRAHHRAIGVRHRAGVEHAGRRPGDERADGGGENGQVPGGRPRRFAAPGGNADARPGPAGEQLRPAGGAGRLGGEPGARVPIMGPVSGAAAVRPRGRVSRYPDLRSGGSGRPRTGALALRAGTGARVAHPGGPGPGGREHGSAFVSLAWSAYRVLAPVLGAAAPAARLFASPRERPFWNERLGRVPAMGATDAWIHAASLGEATAVPPLAEALLALAPGARLFLTATTRAGRERLAGAGAPV